MRKTALDCVYKLAQKDDRVVFIGSDLGVGVLEDMKRGLPKRFFMEGVSEQHIIGMAAGLAMEGFIPYVNTIATFLTRRCYEQIALDLCLQNLPVLQQGILAAILISKPIRDSDSGNFRRQLRNIVVTELQHRAP